MIIKWAKYKHKSIKMVNHHKLFENYLCSFKFFYKSSSLCHFKRLSKSSRCYTICKNTLATHTHQLNDHLPHEPGPISCFLYPHIHRITVATFCVATYCCQCQSQNDHSIHTGSQMPASVFNMYHWTIFTINIPALKYMYCHECE